ncbi:MAG: adenine nucleotide alpha hydrolase family protein [Proteobacteria bacterium]|nr:adenine nucleotide alpha hydrolase family protein [Pseudomonadota bacterium]
MERPVGKCTRCKAPAAVRLPSHNSMFCPDCFDQFFLTAVIRALKIVPLPREAPVAVAVSGGKDSLAVWDVLHRLGFETRGVHLDLGIPQFSEASIDAAREFAEKRGLPLAVHSLEELFGHPLPRIRSQVRMDICSVCGTVKRSYLNLLARQAGAGVLVTGHNLDDEAARLMGNLIHRRKRYLEKLYPFLAAAHPAQAARAKPLYRVDEAEIRAYTSLNHIRPAQGGCPFSRGATSTYYKTALLWMEGEMPGTKRDLLWGHIRENGPPQGDAFGSCERCGEPTGAPLCGVCRLKDRMENQDLKSAGRP